MRISDWSSDVCSSDLLCQRFVHLLRCTFEQAAATGREQRVAAEQPTGAVICDVAKRMTGHGDDDVALAEQFDSVAVVENLRESRDLVLFGARSVHRHKIGRASCRERVYQYV